MSVDYREAMGKPRLARSLSSVAFHKMLKLFLIVVFALFASPCVAQADTANPGKEACKAKIEQLCPGIQPGGGRIRDCLAQHNTSFRQLCPEQAAAMKAGHANRPGGGQGNDGPQDAPVAQPPGGDAPSSDQ